MNGKTSPDEKLASKWLERIESYHRRVEGDPSRWEVHVAAKFDDCGNCGQAFPCDVVKLARAHQQIVDDGHEQTDGECLEACAACVSERVLKEVAGGSDD